MITKNRLFSTLHASRRPIALAIALALSGGVAQAAIINVSGGCTLINAINNANTNTDTDGATGCPAGSGADTLNLKAKSTYTLTAVNNSNSGPNGLPVVTSVITINGNGATVKRAGAANTPNFRLLRIVNGTVTINDLKLSGGRVTGATDYGGGISNNGKLTLNNSTVSGNGALGASSSGSGILNGYGGILTLNNSTVSGNSATGGGGIADFGGTATITNSTISGNRAIGDNGGVGGLVNLGNMKLINSTISGNSSTSPASYGVGGIQNSGTMALVHSTVSNNSIAHGNVAGIQNSRTMTLTNTLVANSQGGADCYSYMGGSGTPPAITTFRGVNIVEDGTCGVAASTAPKLGALLDNGGPTLTRALLAGSPAIDTAATPLCKANDQRNIKRPQPTAGKCDIGAFERLTTVPASVASIVQFFDAQVASGGIVGVESFTIQKRIAVRNQLLAAGHYRSRNLSTLACSQLDRTRNRIDPDATPDSNDYVTGSSGDELTAQINSLRTNWACN